MNNELPIMKVKEQILTSVKTNDTVIIVSETGSGKSTQVPQFLYEAGYEVVVTQPRRLAAITLADRVSSEVSNPAIVGYHTGFENNCTTETKIKFCTDGLHLVKSLTSNINKDIILVIDEVHEWNLNIETLIAWINKYRSEGNTIKVVLMSATLEKENLKTFFGDAVVVEAQGRTFKVEKQFKESQEVISTITSLTLSNKNVLVFVEGKKEISDLIEELENEEFLNAEIFPLHGDLTYEEQKQCFASYNRSKVIISTNIAQTSITIPDIDAVVDTGLEKRVETIDGIQGLMLNHISKADILQRAGRAGRTKEGTYILCSDTSFDEREEFSTPEIKRVLLDQVVLKLASVGIDADQLEFFHQPDKESIHTAKLTLKALGCLDSNYGITVIGEKISKMPVGSRTGRMIIEAEKLGVVDDVITLAAILEIGSLLQHNHPNANYMKFTQETRADILAELDIWDKVVKHTYPNLKEAGINSRNFFKAKDLKSKLEKSLAGVVKRGTNKNKESIMESYISGYIDLMYKRSFGNEFFTSAGDYKVLDKNSCVKDVEYVVGNPVKIEFKGRFGNPQTMDIIRNACAVNIEDLELKYPHLISEREIYAGYDGYDDEFIKTIVKEFNGFEIDSDRLVDNTDPRYKKEKEEYQLRRFGYTTEEMESRKSQSTVKLGDREFAVRYNLRGDEANVYVDDKNFILGLEDQSEVKLNNGTAVKIICGDSFTSSFSVTRLKYLLAKEVIRDEFSSFVSSLPKGTTGEITKIIQWLTYVGKEATDYNPVNDEEIQQYVGLNLIKTSVEFKMYTNMNRAALGTNFALKEVLRRYVEQTYSKKKFSIRQKDRKIVETEETLKAKENFFKNFEVLIEDLEYTDFEFYLEMIEESYNELTVGFSKYIVAN